MKDGIQFLYCDEEAGDFIHLAGYVWTTPEATREAWNKIEGLPDSDYIVDLYIAEGIIETKFVTAEFIEQVACRPIAELIERGRLDAEHWKERLRDAMNGRRAHPT